MTAAPTPPSRPRYLAGCGAVLAVYGLLAGAAFVRELLQARARGNEAQAIGSLIAIQRGQTRVRAEDLDHDGLADYASLAELSDLQLIDGVLGAGQKAGYSFALATTGPAAGGEARWIATAAPRTPPGAPPPREEVGPSGARWFVVTQEGPVRQSEEGPFELTPGAPLPASALPLSTRTSPLLVALLLGPVSSSSWASASSSSSRSSSQSSMSFVRYRMVPDPRMTAGTPSSWSQARTVPRDAPTCSATSAKLTNLSIFAMHSPRAASVRSCLIRSDSAQGHQLTTAGVYRREA